MLPKTWKEVHMMRDTPSSCTQLYLFWMTRPISPVADVLNGWSLDMSTVSLLNC